MNQRATMQKPCKQLRQAKQRGFAMLEVLVTIIVISFGLLGLAGLQVTGMRTNHGAYMRFIATQQAYDMTDRIRANQSGVKAGNYDAISGTPAANTCITAANGCTPADLATQDAHEWNTRNALLLPSGQGIVCRDNSPNDGTPGATDCSGSGPYAIKIWWRDEKNGGDLKLFATSFQP